jgi:hypothetical protein
MMKEKAAASLAIFTLTFTLVQGSMVMPQTSRFNRGISTPMVLVVIQLQHWFAIFRNQQQQNRLFLNMMR